MDTATLLDQWDLSSMSRHFARFLGKLAGGGAPELELAAALVSQAAEQGHVCLDLRAPGLGGPPPGDSPAPPLPEPAAWAAALRQSSVVGAPGDYRPLILDAQGRLYLYRFWRHERFLAEELRRRAALRTPPADAALLREGLGRLFGHGDGQGCDWQRVAALAALLHPLCVISGGPGTGKTSTVVRILALLVEQAATRPLRLVLAAPTGKAAARLAEAIRLARDGLPVDAAVRARIPGEALTLHRLLGSGRGGAFRHHRGNPLACEVLIVDEASMVDLPLMAALLDALPATARLILLGDRDQLASVEAGAVLGDLCGAGGAAGHSPAFAAAVAEFCGDRLPLIAPAPAPLADNLILLQRSYRFAADSGIGRLARCVNEGDGPATLAALRAPEHEDVHWRPLPPANQLEGELEPLLLAALRPTLQAHSAVEALAAFEGFRLLTALRHGPWGVEQLNRLAEKILARRGLIHPATPFYAGRPILVTGNDYRLGLFNGDVGLIWPDPESNGALRAFFQQAGGELRKIAPPRLPAHETVYAMTVHKSQGSEFDEVLLILPESPGELLSRELLYTGVTRARRKVAVWGEEDLLHRVVGRRVQRRSGLREALWG
ncbi:exodeoxyribonuclease V subunit alpha [Geoalkalibacter sp.]|uniref:exodeoxyribonuclease V subunit alpha n=1 Tax=Geoalkalibacter sp. TaxID=3041440 RepID=UPI00272EC1C6|nr:exodeoxyribonuclease V subunit alpha [Geoalkalibacter sp.]